MSRPLLRFVGVVAASSWSFQIQCTSAGGPWLVRTIAIPDGDYWLSDDASADDLLDTITDLVNAYAELNRFYVEINALGVAQITTGEAGVTATLTWTSSGTALRDMLRLGTAATLALTEAVTAGTRTCGTLFYPSRGVSIDSRERLPLATQVRMDSGRTETDDWGEHTDAVVRFVLRGEHRSTTATEYKQLDDFHADIVASGARFRYYPDRAILVPWERDTAPWGYETWVVQGPPPFRPAQKEQGLAIWYEQEWRLSLYV